MTRSRFQLVGELLDEALRKALAEPAAITGREAPIARVARKLRARRGARRPAADAETGPRR